jgi:hypothetical protein
MTKSLLQKEGWKREDGSKIATNGKLLNIERCDMNIERPLRPRDMLFTIFVIRFTICGF